MLPGLDLFFPDPASGFPLLFIKLVVLGLGLLGDSLFGPEVVRVNEGLIVTVGEFLKILSGFEEEVAGHGPDPGGRGEAGLCDYVDGAVVSPDVPLVEFDHEFE